MTDAARTIHEAMSEAEFLAQIIEAAHLYGWRAVHFRPGMIRRGDKPKWVTPVQGDGVGFPDLILVHEERGQLLFVEVKSEKGRLTKPQQEWLWLLSSLVNCWAFCWRPSMWDSIVAILSGEHAGNLAQGGTR